MASKTSQKGEEEEDYQSFAFFFLYLCRRGNTRGKEEEATQLCVVCPVMSVSSKCVCMFFL